MIHPNLFEELSDSLVNMLPQGLLSVKDDLKKNFQTQLQHTFAKMDLVTREEFDVQKQVLARTREKLTELEDLLANKTNDDISE